MTILVYSHIRMIFFSKITSFFISLDLHFLEWLTIDLEEIFFGLFNFLISFSNGINDLLHPCSFIFLYLIYTPCLHEVFGDALNVELLILDGIWLCRIRSYTEFYTHSFYSFSISCCILRCEAFDFFVRLIDIFWFEDFIDLTVYVT